MEYLAILIAWWLLFPFLRFFVHDPLLFLFFAGIGVFLYRRRRRNQVRRTTISSSSSYQPPLSDESSAANATEHTLVDLLILRNELARQRAEGTSDPTFCDESIQKIDTLCSQSLERLQITPRSQRWRERREAAWELLTRYSAEVSGPLPWRLTETEEPAQLSLPFQPRSTNPPSAREPHEKPLVFVSPVSTPVPPAVAVPPLPDDAAALLKPTPPVPPSHSVSRSAADLTSVSASESVPDSTSTDAAWAPAAPSVLERTFQTVSGWPALLVPFLVQNILWFICGLCFVAGSTFLVSSTSGTTNALAVSTVLLLYTLALLWGGYRLRRAKPELATSSSVLLCLGALLIPLNIASTVRLTSTAQSVLWMGTGVLITITEFGIFYYIMMLVSGVMDRSLQGKHPQLYLALVAIQGAIPILTWYPLWPLLAVTHCCLLGLLSYSLYCFVHDWVHSIFVEKQKIAYYAAGTLVYAAAVSFIHVAWSVPFASELPAGYYSPFLMALCGLLFYVDSQCKQWVKRYAYLSRMSFAIYGLSVLALLLCLNAPTVQLFTLSIAIVVYGVVAWQYTTLTPFSLLLICSGWLYHSLFLQYIPPQWHLLASLPGLVGLLVLGHWLHNTRASMLTPTCCWVWFGVTVTLAARGLLHMHPSLLAMSSTLTAATLIFFGFRFVPLTIRRADGTTVSTDLCTTPWFYTVPALTSIAIAYAPQGAATMWTIQTAWGLVALAAFWATLCLSLPRILRLEQTGHIEVLLNSALLNLICALILAVTLVFPDFTQYFLLPLLLVSIGGVFLWMGLALRVPWLMYAVLGMWGGAGTIFKLTYFPYHGAGTIEMGLALAVWGLLWWLEHEPGETATFRREQIIVHAQQPPSLTLLWRFPVASNFTYRDMLRLPLQQTMSVLWLVGVLHLGRRYVDGVFGWSWALSASLGARGAALGAGYFRALPLLLIAFLLGLGACLVAAFQFGVSTPAGLGFVGTLYAFLMWYLVATLLTQPKTGRVTKWVHLGGNWTPIEEYSHWTSIIIILLCIAIPLILTDVFILQPALLGVMLSSIVFFGLAGWHYCKQFHSYLLLEGIILGVTLCYMWTAFTPTNTSLYVLFRAQGLGLMASIVGLTFWLISWILTKQRDRLQDGTILLLHNLYQQPLCIIALMLAVFAATQQLSLAWLNSAQTITPFSICVALLAALVLFLTSSSLGSVTWQTTGFLLAIVALLWTESLVVHSTTAFSLWPGGTAASDQWFTSAFIAVSLATPVYSLYQRKAKEPVYARSLFLATTILYQWALLGMILLFFGDLSREDVYISLAFFTLTVGLFPLSQLVANAARTRGIMFPLLASAFLISTLPLLGLQQQLEFVMLLWGFALWIVGNLVLPLWNKRRPQWAITPDLWSWFGLLAVSLCLASSFVSSLQPSVIRQLHPLALLQHAGYFTIGAVYCFLMLRNSTWSGFSWTGVFLLTRIGATLATAWCTGSSETISSVIFLLISPSIAELLWLNALLLVVPWWHVHGEILATQLGWQQHNLPRPFLLLPAGYFFLRLFHFVLLLCSNNISILFPAGEVQWFTLLFFAISLTFSFGHLWWRHHQTWEGHFLFAALTCSALVMCPPSFAFPLFLALWSAAMRAAYSLWEKQQWGGEQTEPLRHIFSCWLEPSLVAAIAALVLVPVPIETQLLTLLVLINTAAFHGWQCQQRQWLIAAGAMTLLFLHVWPLLWIPMSQVTLILPWYALQFATFSCLLLWLSEKGQAVTRQDLTESTTSTLQDRYLILAPLLDWAWRIIAAIALVEWLLHGLSLVSVLATAGHPQWLCVNIDVAAAMSAAGLLLVIGIWQVWKTRQATWTYEVAAFAVMVGFYLRLVIIGLTPASVWDTAVFLMVNYALFALYHFVRLEPLLHVVWTLPLLLLVTIPFQLGSPHAGTTCIAVAALYLLTQYESKHRLPVYLALLTLNAAIYLWIPLWAEHHHVIYLYVVPISTSLLILAHLHRRELQPSVLSAIRLAATTLLYVSATSDVFLRPGLGMFVIIFGVSLVGVLAGVALRVRAFLYTGLASIVLNIGWQLLMLFPEQRFGQAVILLALAAALAGIMVWFNAQRETILQRVRVFRTDLETWA